jgi:SWI/SNF-related matrix-associated actin-dependent regulator of chromatin subfamily A-like protein 1
MSRLTPRSSVRNAEWEKLAVSPSPNLPNVDRIRTFVGADLFDQLFEYQRDAVAFIISHRGRALLSLDMGLGKTVVSISVMEAYRTFNESTFGVVLVVCPSKVCGQFGAAIRRWLPRLTQKIIVGKLSEADSDVRSNIPPAYIVMSYTQARLSVQALQKYRLVGIIADESHQLKNSRSATVCALRPLFQKVKRVLLLSGSPMNRPRDIWVQCSLLQPLCHPLNNELAFRVRYCGPTVKWISRQQYRWEYNGRSHTEELNQILQQKIMFRLERSDVLPANTKSVHTRDFETTPARTIIHVHGSEMQTSRRQEEQSLDGNQRDLIVARNKTWTKERHMDTVVEVPDGVDIEQQKQQAEFLRFKLLCAKAKLKAVRSWLFHFIRDVCNDKKEKIVLFAEHHAIFNELEQIVLEALSGSDSNHSCLGMMDPARELGKLFIPRLAEEGRQLHDQNPGYSGLPFIRIDGASGSIRTITKELSRFKDVPQCRVAIVSIKAGGAGIELTSANHVIFVETTFNGDDLIQAEARCLRIGQTRRVNTMFLILNDSVEENVWEIVHRKLTHMSRIIENRPLQFKIDNECILHDQDIKTVQQPTDLACIT